MTRRRGVLLAVLLVGVYLAIWGGPEGLTILAVGVVFMIVAAVASFLYLVRQYRRLAVPRPAFFRMLLDAQVSKLALGGWVGYVTVSRLTAYLRDQGVISWWIPAPGPIDAARVSALVIIVALMPPVYYALRIMLARRAAKALARATLRAEREG
jgi:hypothetical protein